MRSHGHWQHRETSAVEQLLIFEEPGPVQHMIGLRHHVGEHGADHNCENYDVQSERPNQVRPFAYRGLPLPHIEEDPLTNEERCESNLDHQARICIPKASDGANDRHHRSPANRLPIGVRVERQNRNCGPKKNGWANTEIEPRRRR